MTGKYTFPNHKRGDTFKGASFEMKINRAPMDLTDALIRCHFRPQTNQNILSLIYTTDDNSILVIDNVITLTQRQLDLEPGVYLYDLEIEFPNETIRTYIEGSLTIVNDITKW